MKVITLYCLNNNSISDLLSDLTQIFKKLQSDLTLRRRSQLQRYLRKLYWSDIYRTSSQPARLKVKV